MQALSLSPSAKAWVFFLLLLIGTVPRRVCPFTHSMLFPPGGVIEAYPPSEDITNVTVDMLIGAMEKSGCCQQGTSFFDPFISSGTTMPQTSVDPKFSVLCAFKLERLVEMKNVIGHFSIDLVTFIDPSTMEQQVS